MQRRPHSSGDPATSPADPVERAGHETGSAPFRDSDDDPVLKADLPPAADDGEDVPDDEATPSPAGASDRDPLKRDPTDPDDPPQDAEAPQTAGLFKRVLIGIGITVALLVAFRLAAPHVGFLNDTWQKVRRGDPVWLIGAVILEVFSFVGYVWVFNATTRRSGLMLPRFTSWRIVLAGVAATRLLATAGAGGIASTTFALRRHGLDARHAGATVTAQIAIVYVWFILLIAVTGAAAYLFGRGHPAITIVPAGIATLVLIIAAVGRPGLRRLALVSGHREGRVARVLASVPATLDEGVHTVAKLVRERDIAIVGGALWWLADAGVLWAACHAFGASPNMLDILMAYLLGQVANLLPIPGGLGVEAGLLGMLIAFGVPGGVAVLASLVQRLISTWLPALPGALALAAIGRPSPDAEVVAVDDRPPPGALA